MSRLEVQNSSGVRSGRLALAKTALLKAEAAQGLRAASEKTVRTSAFPPGVYHVETGGSASVEHMVAALVEACGDEQWAALVGFPDVGWEAATRMGLDVSRVVAVPKTGDQNQIGKTLGILVEGFDVVAVGDFWLPSQTKRALTGRVRSAQCLLLTTTRWVGFSHPLPQRRTERTVRAGREMAG